MEIILSNFINTSLGIVFLFSVALLGQIVANSRKTTHMSAFLKNWANQYGDERLLPVELVLEARQRADLYNILIEENHLEDGMVVHATASGEKIDRCDSLLFSSLRYVALKKLGLDEKAGTAWDAIAKSQNNGHWYRHPKCSWHSTSRDMVLGVLMAFSQDPPENRAHISKFLAYVSDNNGFFSKGRIDQSYLTPGVARFLHVYAMGNKIVNYLLPPAVTRGFSTVEFSAMVPQQGYASHLIAMNVWLEMELLGHQKYSQLVTTNDTPINKVSFLTNPFTESTLEDHRLDWITSQLQSINSQNLFYQWLRLKSAGALNSATKAKMLRKLLSMSQFPSNRLPNNCDRKADYMWQRAAWEYEPFSSECEYVFNGVDFLWMVGLLLEDQPTYERRAENIPASVKPAFTLSE